MGTIASIIFNYSENKNIVRHQVHGCHSNCRELDKQFTKTFHEWLGETVSIENIITMKTL